MHTVNFTDARQNFKAVIDRVVNDHDATLIHRREGGHAVLVSADAYSAMMETLHLLSSPANAKALTESIAQFKAGKAKARALVAA